MNHGHKNLLVALAGQPNSGKSTIFNMLTGARQHVANFPGVTVEKKQGRCRLGENKVEIVDLPGTYSLTSYSQEERIARDFILLEQPEVVVVVVDAANLERNLYLVFQLREMGMPMVLCLNMMDVAERRGFRIDVKKLSAALGIPVVPTVGTKGKGREALKQTIQDMCDTADHTPGAWRLDYGERLEPCLHDLEKRLQECEHLMEDFPARWLAVKLMENDAEARRILLHHTHDESGQALCDYVAEQRRDFADAHKKSPEKIIATQRYRTAAPILEGCMDRKEAPGRTLTDKIDRVVLHRALAPIILALILLLFYQITMLYGAKLANLCFPYIQMAQGPIRGLFQSSDLLRDGLFQSLIGNALAGGIIAVLYYVPIFVVLFALIAVLEDTGYMARIAFIMDRVLRGFGLHGQSTLPMLLGGVIVGGCAIPGVMATRVMKDEKARLVTILIMPLMNCMAKIPFYVLIIGIFFAAHQGLTLFGLSLFSFVVALLVAKLFSRYLVTGETAPFVMELPAYHLPTVGGVLRQTAQRVWLFLRKVVTVVAAVQILVWFFITFPGIGTGREVHYDRQIAAAKAALMKKIGTRNPYAAVLRGDNLIACIQFQRRYKAQKQRAGQDAPALLRLAKALEFDNREFFLLANKGKDAEGKTDKDAKRAARALRGFVRSAGKLKRERKKSLVRNSYAGRVGRFLEPVSGLAGFNWRMNIAMISSFAAKESLVGTLGTIYSAEEGKTGTLSESIRTTETQWTVWHVLAMLVFVALFPPCLATLIMIRLETNSYKWLLFASIYPIVLGFILAAGIFQFGQLIG